MSTNDRRKWSAEDKLRMVLTGMQPGVEVSELCRREGLHPNMYYLWKKQLLGSASKIFEAKSDRASAAEERKAAEMRRLKNVIAEITAENLELKKGSRIRRLREVAAGVATACARRSAAAAIDRLAKGADGQPVVKPLIQSDNGSSYIAREFLLVLKERVEERRQKMAQARHRRRETNLKLQQRTIPFSEAIPVSSI